MRVITTGGSDEKEARCRELGADLAINYRTDDVLKRSAHSRRAAWTCSGRHCVNRTSTTSSLLAERGRIVLMAGRDARPAFPVGPFYVKNCSMYGVAMFKATVEELQNCGDEINLWFVEGNLQPHIAVTLPLSEAAAAHRLQEENTLGKKGSLSREIVLTVG